MNEELEPEQMLFDLLGNNLEVVLIPAPDKKFSTHCIRAVQYSNTFWYRKFCSLYPPNRKTRCSTIIKRSHTIRALKQIIDGQTSEVYIERILNFIKLENSKLEKPNKELEQPENSFDWLITI